MSENDKEIKKALQQLYKVSENEHFVNETLQRLPRHKRKRIKFIIGNIVIWSSVILSAAIFYKEIFLSMANIVQNLSMLKMPDKEPMLALFICAMVIVTAIMHSMEFMDDYYNLPLKE